MWGAVRVRWAVLISTLTILVTAFLDVPILVPIKAAVIQIIPLSEHEKAPIVRALCDRAFIADWNAASNCYIQYSSPSTRQANTEFKQSESDNTRICQGFASAFLNGVPKGLISAEDGTWYLIPGGVFEDPLLKSISESGLMATFDEKNNTVLLQKGFSNSALVRCDRYQ